MTNDHIPHLCLIVVEFPVGGGGVAVVAAARSVVVVVLDVRCWAPDGRRLLGRSLGGVSRLALCDHRAL